MKFRSIFQRIMVPMVLIVCLLGTGILMIVSRLFQDIYERQIYEENNKTANFVAQSVGSFMNMAYRITEQLANMDDILSMDTALQTPILEGTVERNDYFELIYIQDMNGDQTGRSSGELGNRANRWWFIQMLETGRPFVSKSYYSVNTNMACASIFIPLAEDGQEIGILATDIKLGKLQEAVAEFSDPENGEICYIIDGEGVVVAHPEAVYYEELYNYSTLTRTVTKKDENGEVVYDGDGNIVTEELPIEVEPEYARMISRAMEGKSGQGQITDGGKEYYISYTPIQMDGSSDSWAVISLREKSMAMALMDRILRAGILATLAAVALAVLMILLLTKTITRPIQYCLERLTALSKGDLSTELPAVKGKDETARLLGALGETIQTLKKIIDDITTQLQRIAEGDVTRKQEYVYSGDFNLLGRSLTEINDSLNRSMREVGVHSAQVHSRADILTESAQSLTEASARQADAVDMLATAVEDTSARIHNGAADAAKAKEKMEQVNANMTLSYDSVQKLTDAMNRIYEDSRRIDGIAKTVQDIASRTHLLSLNASVEAARVGEAGRGFSVIASEIRGLAEHCAQAAGETSAVVETALKEISEGVEMLDTTVSAIHGSADGIQEANGLMGNISDAAAMQVEAMERISDALDKITEVVHNNAEMAVKSAASSMEMKEHTDRLKLAVERYRY